MSSLPVICLITYSVIQVIQVVLECKNDMLCNIVSHYAGFFFWCNQQVLLILSIVIIIL